ncbi:MAG: carboxypeptidase regulatory-like domain-containing protein, partial [Candidatus Solibacter usitatus]|nr:carboxypeptidase regulatory-like domain-containing protein [Candidatus Solibacter usitatus]
MHRHLRLALLLAVAHALPAQTTFSGTVLDPSNTPVPGIRVTLRQNNVELAASTSSTGVFRFENAPAGRWQLSVSVPGFAPFQRAVNIGTRNAQPLLIRLTLASRREEVTISAEEMALSTETGRNANVISVERNLLDTLPILDNNYIAALSRFLDAGSPNDSGTTLIVDGMESRNVGVTASAIQEVRINNNPYTAEYPRWSRRRIEVITKSAADAYHGTFNFLFRDYSMNARDALAVEKPQEQRRIFEGSLFGPLAGRKNTSFLLSGAREEEDILAVIFAQGLNGPIHLNAPAPVVNTVASLRLSHQT